jgi:glycosyltransferase involved in cell wall biosynthesis
MQPLVSVVIPCYNALQWLSLTIKSVIEQNVDGVEIIVIDDGSTDGSSDIVAKEFPEVHLIRTSNQGPSRARNLGMQASHGQFIQFLDADDLLASGKLKLQLEALNQTNDDVAYGAWQYLVKQSDGTFKLGNIVSRKIQTDPEVELFTDFWCPPAAYLFRRSIVEKTGGFRENLPVIQDARFVLDCALYGGRFIYTEKISGYYRVHSASQVSKKSHIDFNRDVLRNAIQIEQWWKDHGGITSSRLKALMKVYGYVARSSFEKDRTTFEMAYHRLKKLKPRYIPEHPALLSLTSRIVGYRNAEFVALGYRTIKRRLKKLISQS